MLDVRTLAPEESMAAAARTVYALLVAIGPRDPADAGAALHALNVHCTLPGVGRLLAAALCAHEQGRHVTRAQVHALVSPPLVPEDTTAISTIAVAGQSESGGLAAGASAGAVAADCSWLLEAEGLRSMLPGTPLGSGSFGHAVVVAFDGVGSTPVVCKTAVERPDYHRAAHASVGAKVMGRLLVPPGLHAARPGVCGRAPHVAPTGSRRAVQLAHCAGGAGGAGPGGAGGASLAGGAGGAGCPPGPLVLDAAHPDGTPASALQWEAQVLLRIHHPNVVRALRFAAASPKAPACLTLEWCHGNLSQLLRLDGPRLTVAIRCDLVAQVCRGLAAVHDAGLVHYDVAPRNVLILFVGRCSLVAKVADLGCSRPLGAAGLARYRDTPNCCQYPEVADGVRMGVKRCVTTALDTFSLSLFVFPVLFDAAHPLPPHLDALVGKCGDVSPAARPTMPVLCAAFGAAATVGHHGPG